MRALHIPVSRVSRILLTATICGLGGMVLLLDRSTSPAAAASAMPARDPAATVVPVADPAPAEPSAKPAVTSAPRRSPTTTLRTTAQPLIPPAALPAPLSAPPPPYGPLPLETAMLPLDGVAGAPAAGEPTQPPDKPKTTAP